MSKRLFSLITEATRATTRTTARTTASQRIAIAAGPCKLPSSFNSFQRSFSSSVFRLAISTDSPPSATDPTAANALSLIDQGNASLEAGDFHAALSAYQRSLDLQESTTGLYNLGVCYYQLGQHSDAISAWERSLKLTDNTDPSSTTASTSTSSSSPPSTNPAVHGTSDILMNLASAYILSKPPRTEKAIESLKAAVKINPFDAEIRFNFAVVLESAGLLDDALAEYRSAKDMGIERADQNIRNVGAKILRQRIDNSKNNP